MSAPEHGDGESALERLRAAVRALPGAEVATGDAQTGEPADDDTSHVARYEAVHEALVAVLADVDRT